VILVDTSAWVEFLRGTDHPVTEQLNHLLAGDTEVVVTEIVLMELLAGARSGRHLRALRSRLLALPVLALEGLQDFEEAALLYRICRAGGETLRTLTDCLIAVPAIRAGAAVLHEEADFDVLSRHTDLMVYSPSA
jgi:predicted nucleic acid-binding protein